MRRPRSGAWTCAYKEFDEVLVVPLPPGTDPAEVAGDFEDRLAAAVPYPRYRVKLEIDRSRSDAEAFTSIREIMSGFDANTEWMDAIRYAADRLDLPHNLQAMLAPTTTRKVGQVTRRVLEAGERLERDALAGVLAYPDLVGVLREVTPDHFDVEAHRRLRAVLVEGADADSELTALRAELDARAAAEESTSRRRRSSSSASASATSVASSQAPRASV